MDAITFAHWEMLDCLSDEIFLGMHEETLYGKEFLYEIFLYFATLDPRFNAVGLGRDAKRHLQFIDHHGRIYLAEGAIAAFLGLGMKGRRVIINDKGERFEYQCDADYLAVGMIYRRHADINEFNSWLRWHVQKIRGYTVKYRELDHGYPAKGTRQFPDTLKLINELYPEKD